MRDRPINLGILAHIDAGKTSLTERLLFETGVINRLGSVDAGTTQTDTNEIERRRGITIRAAVTSFTHNGRQVNVIDTPGHSEFVAEVQRALAVLDGVILVISAVEGIQAHTKVLMQTLRRMEIPTLLFVNKIDRHGARDDSIVEEIRRWLDVEVVLMTNVLEVGKPAAEVLSLANTEQWAADTAELLAVHDMELLDDVVSGRSISQPMIVRALRAQTSSGRVCPLYFGSARTGQGAAEILDGIVSLLRSSKGDEDENPQGVVFAIERVPDGPKLALVRLEAGQIHTRDLVDIHRRTAEGAIMSFHPRATAIEVIGAGASDLLLPGHIGRVQGFHEARVGDRIGPTSECDDRTLFAPPTLETIVCPDVGGHSSELHSALVSLTEQDPLIDTRVLPNGDISVLLYGEIQKEVLAETLLTEFGVRATFAPSSILHMERPLGVGSVVVPMGRTRFVAGIGLRVEHGLRGSGVTYHRETEYGALTHAFHLAIEETVKTSLQQGLYGWPVSDCRVTLIHSEFDNACSTGGDFRLLTPLVVLGALRRAGSSVYEPCQEFDVEVPADCLSLVMSELLRLEAAIEDTQVRRDGWSIQGSVPLRLVQSLTVALPGLTRGEGSCSFWPRGDRLVRGVPPERARSDGNPLRLKEYLHFLSTRQQRSV